MIAWTRWFVLSLSLALVAGCFASDDDPDSDRQDVGGGADEDVLDVGEDPGEDEPDAPEDEPDVPEDEPDVPEFEPGMRLEGGIAPAEGAELRGAGFVLIGNIAPIGTSDVLRGAGFELRAAPVVLRAPTSGSGE